MCRVLAHNWLAHHWPECILSPVNNRGCRCELHIYWFERASMLFHRVENRHPQRITLRIYMCYIVLCRPAHTLTSNMCAWSAQKHDMSISPSRSLSLSLYIYIYVYISIPNKRSHCAVCRGTSKYRCAYVYMYMVSMLSIYIFLYIYIYIYMHIYIYIARICICIYTVCLVSRCPQHCLKRPYSS